MTRGINKGKANRRHPLDIRPFVIYWLSDGERRTPIIVGLIAAYEAIEETGLSEEETIEQIDKILAGETLQIGKDQYLEKNPDYTHKE